MQGKAKVQLNSLWPRLFTDDFFIYNISFTAIASGTGSSTYELNVGDKDFQCMQFYMSMLDANGVHYPEALNSPAFAQLDGFTLDIVSSDDQRFMSNAIDVWALNTLKDNDLFKGMTFYNRTKYNFTVAGNNNLAKAAYPLTFTLDMIGYKLQAV